MRHTIFELLAVVTGISAGVGGSRGGPAEPLRPCPPWPNCVSSDASDPKHAIPPVAFADTPAAAQLRARAALLAEPRTRIVVDRPGYLHAESRSRVFRFVDDVEIAIDSAASRFRLRSASRLGRNDFGMNRARMERVSARLQETGAASEPRR